MKPGDTIHCWACQTQAVAYTTGDPAHWKEGDALMISWFGYRHEAAVAQPEICLACRDLELGAEPWRRQAPTRRVAICDDLALHGCRTDGFEWNTDADVEAAYQRWIAAGRPPLTLVQVHHPPAVAPRDAQPPAPASHGQLGLFS